MSVDVGANPVSQLAPRERVELILSHLDHLPTLPALAARLLAATTSEKSCAADVVELIEADVSLTAAVLRMVRRADLGLPAQPTTVARAVTLLGFKAVRNVMLSLQVFEAFDAPAETNRAAHRRREFWKHSLATACASEMIAERTGGATAAGEAFVCGLLHDIGKVALDVCLPKAYARVVEQAERRHACICDVEREFFGLDHTGAGRRLATRWGLPQAVVDCVWLHHQGPEALPSSVTSPEVVHIVHLADNLVRRQRIGFSGYHSIADVKVLAAALGVDESGLDGVAKRLPERMEPFCELVGLDDSTGRTLYAESLAKANEELGRVNAELAESNRRLKVRSTCFEALGRFARMLTPHDRVGDVCKAAAAGIRAMLEVECAVAFFLPHSSRFIHAGRAGPSGQDPATTVLDLGRDPDATGLAGLGDGWPTGGMLVATEACEIIWQRAARTPPVKHGQAELVGGTRAELTQDPLWMLPFTCSGGGVGAVLFAAPEQVVRPFKPSSAECEALSTAVGMAVSSAMGRVEAERLNEELLDLNRRMRAGQQEVVRARSISMIAEMAAGAAHELNNPLAVVSGRAQMVQAQTADPKIAREMQIIAEQTQRATRIVTDLMRFAKPEPPDPIEQPLLPVLQRLLQHWAAGSPLRTDQVTVCTVDPVATVYADPEQLTEILTILLANGLEATQPETARLQVNSPSRASDDTVRIVITDNGVGMSPEVLEHAADPFFSNRPAGRGRGLGLSRATRLAEINGGRLWLESTPKIGTAATIELPARAKTECRMANSE